MNNNTLKPLPKIGEFYHFFDDGKTSPGRHYICKCEQIIPIKETNKIVIERNDEDIGKVKYTLNEIWVSEKLNHDWLYANKTDYIIVCSCPKYDEDLLYFCRTKDGGWFSMNTTNCWQSGRLDIDNKIYEYCINYYELNNYNTYDYEQQTY